MCSDNVGAYGEPNGECPDCGSPTVDGESIFICGYSRDEPCETCGCAGCDESC
jgi:hypothetical protein